MMNHGHAIARVDAEGHLHHIELSDFYIPKEELMNDAPQREMPRYQCHKKVWALKIGEGIVVNPNGTFTLTIADGGYGTVTVDPDVVQRRMPMPGDYLVTYDDGYVSISPAKAFEEGYTRI